MLVDRNEGRRVSEALVQGFRVLQAFTAANPTLSLTQVAARADLDSGTASVTSAWVHAAITAAGVAT